MIEIKYRIAPIFRTSDKWLRVSVEDDVEDVVDVKESGVMKFTEWAKNKYHLDSFARPLSIVKNNATVVKTKLY